MDFECFHLLFVVIHIKIKIRDKNWNIKKWHVKKWNIYLFILIYNKKKTNVCIKLELI
jgi:hypothetical protein